MQTVEALKEALRPIVAELVREALGQLANKAPAEHRTNAGLSRKELCNMVPGLTEATLSRYESGTITNIHHPSVVRQTRLIAKALGVEFSAYLKSIERKHHA